MYLLVVDSVCMGEGGGVSFDPNKTGCRGQDRVLVMV